MLFDNRTLVFSLMMVCAMTALSLAVVSWGREHDSLKKWAGAMSLEALGFMLIALRGVIPDFIAFGCPVVLIVAAQSVKLAAIREYRGLSWQRWHCLVPIGLALLIFLTLPLNDFRGRLIWGSLIFGAQMVMILQAMLDDTESRAGRAWWLLFGTTLLILPFALLRAIAAAFELFQFADVQSGIAPNPVQMSVFAAIIAMSQLGSLGFILMVKERADRKLRALAMIDSLTGVYNRRAFMQRADKEYAIARRNGLPLALLMLDIDHFKRINDQYGHPAGDAVLTEIARLLESRLRKQDTLGRYGGEEFCILLPATDVEGARALAESLRVAVEGVAPPAACDDLKITTSIGVTVCPAQCANCEGGIKKLLDEADAALYRAKNAGRNRVDLQPIACAAGLETAAA